jgi:hypothetical protein
MPKVTREQVYAVIDGERDYQDSLSGDSETGGVHTVAEWALYIGSYADDLQRVLSHTWGPNATAQGLDIIRKITAMGVACQEQNGVVRRGDVRKSAMLPPTTNSK